MTSTTARAARRIAGAALAAALAAGCDRKAPDAAAPPASASGRSASPEPAPRAAASAPEHPAVDPALTGAWKGTYDSTAHRIDLATKQGGLPEWASDDGKRGTGRGTLALTIAPDGAVTGTSEGALGTQEVRGALDGDTVSLRLAPGKQGEFAGTLVARRDGPRFVGTFQASSADGRVARAGAVTLSRD